MAGDDRDGGLYRVGGGAVGRHVLAVGEEDRV